MEVREIEKAVRTAVRKGTTLKVLGTNEVVLPKEASDAIVSLSGRTQLGGRSILNEKSQGWI